MITKTECHLRALVELIELISIGGWLAVLADVIWVFSDLRLSPERGELYFIATILSFTFVLTSFALVKYHFKCVTKLLETGGKATDL